MALAMSASPALAGPSPTPSSGKCGAANMSNAGTAMTTAMEEHTDEHGDAGMKQAIANSACRGG
jgi:hypothetical protein